MILEIDGLTHRYGDEQALEGVSFGVERGELVAILGPSGCGKTTILQAIAGHVSPTAGRVRLRGEDVTETRPESRRVGLVFQRPTLYPHMTIDENIRYGLAARDIDGGEQDDIVTRYLELVDIAEQREAHPSELSGGQARRAELARALAPQPEILLLDEPLSALDRALRDQLREEIARIQRETGVTTLFVTHDQEEAMALADRLVVVNDGRVSAIGEPRALYESPPTPFVASFLGRSNAFTATVTDSDPLTIDLGTGTITLETASGERAAGDRIRCHVRPDALSIRDDDGSTPSLGGVVTRVSDLGRRYDVTVQADAGPEFIVERAGSPPAVDERVSVALPERELIIFDA